MNLFQSFITFRQFRLKLEKRSERTRIRLDALMVPANAALTWIGTWNARVRKQCETWSHLGGRGSRSRTSSSSAPRSGIWHGACWRGSGLEQRPNDGVASGPPVVAEAEALGPHLVPVEQPARRCGFAVDQPVHVGDADLEKKTRKKEFSNR